MSSNKKRIVLVHHHIFKNAGTSFNYSLKQVFGDTFREYDLPNNKVVTSENLELYLEANLDVNAISGHHICLPTPQGENYQTISSVIIRNPLARVRSIYNFERRQEAETEGAVMAKKLSFKEFVTWRLNTSSQVFCNYQTLYCSRKSNLGPRYNLKSEDLKTAFKNLDSCFVVGTVDRYDEFLTMTQKKLNNFFPQIVLQNTHLNVTKTSQAGRDKLGIKESLYDELGRDIASELERLNKFDDQLYLYANQKLNFWIEKNTSNK